MHFRSLCVHVSHDVVFGEEGIENDGGVGLVDLAFFFSVVSVAVLSGVDFEVFVCFESVGKLSVFVYWS